MSDTTPDAFLSSKQLTERAIASRSKAQRLAHGKTRDRFLKSAKQDEAMARIKRLLAGPNANYENP